MYKVEFKCKPTIIWDEAILFGDVWSLRFFDVWHNVHKSLIKSVEKL